MSWRGEKKPKPLKKKYPGTLAESCYGTNREIWHVFRKKKKKGI